MLNDLRLAATRSDLIAIVKLTTPLTQEGERWWGCCPFHEEKTKSFAIMLQGNRQRFRCFACGEKGDAVDYIALRKGITKARAAKLLLSGKHETQGVSVHFRAKSKEIRREDWEGIDWPSYVKQATAKRLADIAQWRGYSLRFCWWLKHQGLIGFSGDAVAFPVTHGGKVCRAQCRMPERKGWFYRPKQGPGVTPLIIGDGDTCHLFESQWDLFAAMDSCGYNLRPRGCWVATRSSSNFDKLKELGGRFKAIYIYKQNDVVSGKKTNKVVDHWAESIAETLPGCVQIEAPQGFKDINDYTKAGGRFIPGC